MIRALFVKFRRYEFPLLYDRKRYSAYVELARTASLASRGDPYGQVPEIEKVNESCPAVLVRSFLPLLDCLERYSQ